MKIVLASALFPPDIAPPAPYVKELISRLSTRYSVEAVVYGRLPERVPGVLITGVDKRRPALLRLVSFFNALRRASKGADAIYVENGASVELPALLLSLAGYPIVLHLGDAGALARGGIGSTIHRILARRARYVIDSLPKDKPEILPLSPRPEKELQEWERSWQEHIGALEHTFHAR